MSTELNFDDFSKIDIRVGTVIDAYFNKDSIKPAYILSIDFGPLGVYKSSAQITKNYKVQSLVDTQVTAIINFPKKQIGKTMSSCLVLGVAQSGDVTLIKPLDRVINGSVVS